MVLERSFRWGNISDEYQEETPPGQCARIQFLFLIEKLTRIKNPFFLDRKSVLLLLYQKE